MKNHLSELYTVEILVMRLHKWIELLENAYYIYDEVSKERRKERGREKGGREERGERQGVGKGARSEKKKKVSFKV